MADRQLAEVLMAAALHTLGEGMGKTGIAQGGLATSRSGGGRARK